MQLPGHLSASTLGDLLGSLHRERITGRLELTERTSLYSAGAAGRRHTIHLSHGLILFVESDLPVMPLGEILRREGLVATAAINFALFRIGSGDRRAAGEILIEAGLARPEYVRAGLRKQQKLRLDALFGLKEAAIAFHTARPLGGPEVRSSPLWPADFLHGRPRSRDRIKPGGAGSYASGRAEPPRAPAAGAGAARGEAAAEPPRARAHATPLGEERERARRLLGVSEGASTADVRRAFRRLAAALHPDRHTAAPSEVQARNAARFARISAAYHLLVAS